MAEIELTLPTVQYGNVKVRATPEELGVDIAEPGSVGMIAAMYTNLFTQGFKRGSAVNVTLDPETAISAPRGASCEAEAALHQVAVQALQDGLGGVTEVPEGEVARPWDQKVDAKKKPWETGETATKAVSEDW